MEIPSSKFISSQFENHLEFTNVSQQEKQTLFLTDVISPKHIFAIMALS